MIHRPLLAVPLIAAVLASSTFAADQRLKLNPPANPDAPPVLQARSHAQVPNQAGPTEPFGRMNRGGAERAAQEFSKAYKKTINKSQITGPIELTVDHLGEGPDRFLDFHQPMSVVPGAAKFGARSGLLGPSTPVVALHFKPFKPNVRKKVTDLFFAHDLSRAARQTNGK